MKRRARCIPSPACGGGRGRGYATRFMCASSPPPQPPPPCRGGSRPSSLLALDANPFTGGQSMTRKGLAVVVALAAAVFADTACAQFYKGKTVTMIINYPAGGPTDIEGRIVAQHLPAHIAGKPTIALQNFGR